MTPLQIELTRLIGKKELTFGCLIKNPFSEQYYRLTELGVYALYIKGIDIENNQNIIGHPATLSDFHRWMNEKGCSFRTSFEQTDFSIEFRGNEDSEGDTTISYDSSKDLLDQEEETLKQILELIKSYS